MGADQESDGLGFRRADATALVAKSVFGACPFADPLLSEIVGNVIPNQRLERLEKFTRVLEGRLDGVHQTVFEERLKTTDGVDHLEDALHQAVRATTEERLKYIASVMVSGLTQEEIAHNQQKHLMWLLGQLINAEVLSLAWINTPRNEEFRKKHWEVVRPRSKEMGSSQETLDEATVYDAYKAHLVSLGLLRPRFKSVRKGEFPEFDKNTGMMKASGHQVAPLGRLLLRFVQPE